MAEKSTLEGILHFHSETGTEGGFWAFQDEKYISDEKWDYQGLYVLQNGDELTIFDEDKQNIIWNGIINLTDYKLFTETTIQSPFYWIHNDQIGVPREVWESYFLEGHPAKLTTKNVRI